MSAKGTKIDPAAFEHHKQRRRKHHTKEIKHNKKVNRDGDDLHSVHGVKITVGPVIGKVTTTTAIVLIEVNALADVTIHLTSETGDKVTQTKRFVENTPATFYVKDLTPGTKYTVVFRWSILPLIIFCKMIKKLKLI